VKLPTLSGRDNPWILPVLFWHKTSARDGGLSRLSRPAGKMGEPSALCTDATLCKVHVHANGQHKPALSGVWRGKPYQCSIRAAAKVRLSPEESRRGSNLTTQNPTLPYNY
jgi:hypothetical protein